MDLQVRASSCQNYVVPRSAPPCGRSELVPPRFLLESQNVSCNSPRPGLKLLQSRNTCTYIATLPYNYAFFNMSTGVGVSSCCLSGKVQEGKPTGRVEEIAGLQTYVAEPENGSKAKTVIFLVDSMFLKHITHHDWLANAYLQSLAGNSSTPAFSRISMPRLASLHISQTYTRATLLIPRS